MIQPPSGAPPEEGDDRTGTCSPRRSTSPPPRLPDPSFMSLRSKIVWLFFAVAIVPLLVLAAFSYRFSVDTVRDVAQERLAFDARSVAAELLREEASVRAALQSHEAAELAALVPAPGGSGLGAGIELSGGTVRLDFLDLSPGPDVSERIVAGDPSTELRCQDGRSARGARVATDLPDGTRVAAVYRVGQTLSRDPADAGHGVYVVDRDGDLVLGSSCAPPTELREALLAATRSESSERAGTFAFEQDDVEVLAAFAGLPSLGWWVGATDESALLASLGRLHLNYWLFVMALALLTVIAFSLLLGRVTRSLQDLTSAVENVERGTSLDPWLPPPTDDEVGRLTVAFSQMLERIREMVAQVDRSGRLAVVGQLSSYLAHEIRNPLSSVKMNLQRLQLWERRGELPERSREPIEISLREVDRLSQAVSDVLQLTRAHEKPAEVVHMHEIVTEAGKLLDQEFARRGVFLRWELDAVADRILARPGQIKGVILNLMLNALEAQPEGGSLTVCSELVPPAADEVPPGPRLAVRFRDDGPGVPPALRDRIFDPFFTTKSDGSGIGLAVAARAVRENDGDLFLEESPSTDAGAEFVMAFPLAAVFAEVDGRDVTPRLAPWLDRNGPTPVDPHMEPAPPPLDRTSHRPSRRPRRTRRSKEETIP